MKFYAAKIHIGFGTDGAATPGDVLTEKQLEALGEKRIEELVEAQKLVVLRDEDSAPPLSPEPVAAPEPIAEPAPEYTDEAGEEPEEEPEAEEMEELEENEALEELNSTDDIMPEEAPEAAKAPKAPENKPKRNAGGRRNKANEGA